MTNLAKRSSLLALFCALCHFLSAQNILISYTKSDSLFVCSTDTFTVKVQNNTAQLLMGASLTIDLPAGLTYLPGTAMGASQQNISNLAAPVFGLPDVPPGQAITVKILLSADCAAADVLDAGQLFVANISVASALGNAQVSTTSIPVETGAIVIESVAEQLLMGERDDILLRTICVRNTRLGKIGSLHFEDAHLAGFDVSVAGAISQANGAAFFSADFEGSFFNSVGNGDAWLDLNESVCFTERIILTSCGIPPFTNTSVLRVGWGCGGEVCRYDSVTAFIEIKPSTKIPDLVFEQVWAPPTDYCGNTPAVMGFKINNIGRADAKDILFSIELSEGLTEAAMRAGSFRMVTASGSIPIAPNVSNSTFLPACGLSELREASFLIPLVAAKDSMLFLFDVLTCVAQCEQVQPAFRANYFYKKDCPPNGFVSGFALILPEDGYVVRGELISLIGTCLESGQSYPFSYETLSKYLTEDGFMHIELDLPLGITLDTSCGTLLGNAAPVLLETTPLPGGGHNVHLAWATPLPADSLAMHFCLHYECDTNIVCLDLPPHPDEGSIYTDYCCFQGLKNAAYWSPAINTAQECAINDCGEQLLGVNLIDCVPEPPGPPGDSTCCDVNIPTPGLRDWWDVYRLNLGYQDSDDDRRAENLLPPAPGTARRDRFLAGDTLRVEYCGVMDSSGMVDSIGRAIWHEIVGSDMAGNDNDDFFVNTAQSGFADSSKVRFIGNTIRVRYADGSEASCSWSGLSYVNDKNYFQVINPNSFPPQPIDEIATEKFFFIYSLPAMFANGCLPKPMLEKGDSIFIFTDFKLDVNFKPSSSNNPDPPLVGFRTASSKTGKVYAWNERPRKYLQYSGWKKTLAPNTHSIKPCENSSEVKKFRYSMRIARENMFPFEVRPLAWISDYRQTLPPDLELASARLEYLTLQDSVPLLVNLTLPFSQPPGFLDIDFSPAFADPVDEGFTLGTNLTFKPNCQFNTPDTSKQYIETSFVGCLNGDKMSVLDSLKNAIGFFSNTPRLKLQTGDTVVYAPSREFEIAFDLKNLVVSSAPAAWVALVSPSGQVSDFELIQMPQNQPVAGANGLFNVGNINGFSQRSFRLKGQNISCETDSLLLIFGWGCAPISSLADSDCGRDTVLIELHLERPELELDVLQEPASLTLCDTSDWFEFEIYNAKIGYAYDLEASVKLPPGLSIVPGTCQISYPEGSPWVNISDPALLAGNLFQWQIDQVQPTLAANGLPGVNLDPQNTFRIRFKTIAECGFVSNTPIIYGTTGIEPCGRQANVLNKPGEPLNILGLNPTYGVQISLQPMGNPSVACGAAQEFSVTLTLLGTPSVGDSVYISLPQGVLFLLNSYTPGLNAPPGPPTLNVLGFQLPLPILQGGGTVQFSFRVEVGAAAGCNDQIILAQTRVRTEAFCQSLGAPCEVYISTGEATWSISPAHPQLSASSANLSISNGQVNGTITVTNIGTVAANGATVQVWRDVDGDGHLSANDVLLSTLQTSATIAPGASVQVTGALAGLDSTQLCGLLFVLPAAENCACDDQVFPLENLNLEHTALVFCALQPVTLGIPAQAGFVYQWQPAPGIACATCPSTLFTPDPNTPPNTPQTLTLTETSSGCTITHTFEISFGAFAQITVGNAVICEGKTTTLAAAPSGTGYAWQGAGIQNPALQTQTIQPAASSTYFVTVTFSNGCTATDSTEIEVLNADTTQLAGLTTCAGEPVEVLGTMTAMPGTYQIVLPKLNGCDSTILQTLAVLPKPMTEEARSFCLGDTLMVADTLFTGSGEVCRQFTSANGCDSTHCVQVTAIEPPAFVQKDTVFGIYGQAITLIGPGGFVTYSWQPMPVPPCPNCQSVMYSVDSAGYREYLLTVAGADGCPGEVLFRLFIFPPCNVDSLHIPNAFTPNGDGSNDVFRVVAHEGAELVTGLEIYDRWGEKVYENQGDAFWDGMIGGKPAPSDVYVYIVKVTCGELVERRWGDVTLLR
ncbi:MAG: gliding motility-associated C-terminal domain-containing protein [Saprospiraceae bacterium]